MTKRDVIVGMPGTSASFHKVYPDAEEVRRTVRKHAEKLPVYRAKLPDGAPVWLLVHSDGWPLSAHIGIDRLMQEAVEVARQVLVQSKHKFDEAWWLDDAVISQDGKLVRLV